MRIFKLTGLALLVGSLAVPYSGALAQEEEIEEIITTGSRQANARILRATAAQLSQAAKDAFAETKPFPRLSRICGSMTEPPSIWTAVMSFVRGTACLIAAAPDSASSGNKANCPFNC